MIKLSITKYENNENYESELKDYKDSRSSYYTNNEPIPFPRREISKNILDVFITEEQFEAIRKAVLENF